MTQSEIETFIAGLDQVEQEENFGYIFYFVGDDHRLPFVTIANSDNEYDNVSNLNREGVFRVNIGIRRERFEKLVGNLEADTVDYSVLNTILPHPDYAKQNFVCILNPSGSNVELTKELIAEAHALAAERWLRKNKE